MVTPHSNVDLPVSALAAAWRSAAARADVAFALEAVYAMMADAVDLRRPVCTASGRCCNFGEFGHLLYVTGLEAAYLTTRLSAPISADRLATAVAAGLCPFQVDRLCAVHALRPMGCRAYYCDPTAQDWQQSLSERALSAIRRLHDDHFIPYRYGEWRAMLALLQPATPAGPIESSTP